MSFVDHLFDLLLFYYYNLKYIVGMVFHAVKKWGNIFGRVGLHFLNHEQENNKRQEKEECQKSSS